MIGNSNGGAAIAAEGGTFPKVTRPITTIAVAFDVAIAIVVISSSAPHAFPRIARRFLPHGRMCHATTNHIP